MDKPLIGGQAVIEGVMMRSPNYYATSVRNEKGKIVSQILPIKSKGAFGKIPFLRGIVNLFEMLIIGTKSLTWSSNQVSDEEDEQLTPWQLTLTLIVSFGIGAILFIGLPYYLSILTGVQEETSPVLFNVIDGVIKIAILVIYLYLISLMNDIKRVFEYHGAEHKAVYCYEDGKKLTPKNVQKFSRFHPRCGTSFILMVALVSILFFSLIPPIVLELFPTLITASFWLRKLVLFFTRLLFVPLIAGITYEIFKLSAKYSDNVIVKFFITPGLWLQHITTREPDNKQVEVAIKSMELVLKKDKLA